jgi:hypothetical protein
MPGHQSWSTTRPWGRPVPSDWGRHSGECRNPATRSNGIPFRTIELVGKRPVLRPLQCPGVITKIGRHRVV